MNKLYLNKMFWGVVVFFCIFCVTEICCAALVRVNATNKITGDTIFVKDIAYIEASDALSEKIANIKISSSPEPGQEKKIPVSLIKSRILSKIKIPDNKPEIIVPCETISVNRDYQVISEESLKRIFEQYINKHLKGKKNKIGNIKIYGNKKLPVGRIKIEVKENKDKNISGHFKLIVNVKHENGETEKIRITGWVDCYESVVYAKQAINKGDIIKENSLYSELTNITKAPSGLFDSISQVKGQVAKSGIRKNAIISTRMVEIVPDIKKGEMVKLVIKSGRLTVTSFGIAMKDAQKGEQITVKNIKSKKLVRGQVFDSGTVEVLF